MFETKRSYLCLTNDQVLERQTNLIHFVARAIGSTFCLCDSNIKYVAKLSLQAVADSYNQSIQGKCIHFSGKEIVYLDRFKAYTGKFPAELLACKTMKAFERLCLQKCFESKKIEGCSDSINLFFDAHFDTEIFQEMKKTVLKLVNDEVHELDPSSIRSILSACLNTPKFEKRDFETSGFKEILNYALIQSDASLIHKLPLSFLKKDGRRIVESLIDAKQSAILIDLLQSTEIDVNLIFPIRKHGLNGSLLHLASFKGDTELVDWLLDNRPVLDHLYPHQEFGTLNCLQYAALGGHLELMIHLIEDRGITVANNHSLLQFAALGGHHELFRNLCDRYAIADLGDHVAGLERLLYWACQGGNLELVRYLIDRGYNPFKHPEYPSFWAFKSGNLALVKFLRDLEIERRGGHYSLSAEDYTRGRKAIHLACESGNLELVKYILEANPQQLYAATSASLSPLHFACLSNNYELVEWLLERDTYTTLKLKNIRGFDIFDIACYFGNVDLIEWLVDKKGFNLKATRNTGSLSILDQAAFGGHLGLLNYLVLNKGLKIPSHKMAHYAIPQETKNFLSDLYKRQNWDLNYPVLAPKNIAFELPEALQDIEEPESSWKELETIQCKPEYKSGLRNLYHFVLKREVRPSTGGDAYWSKMEKYLGHLVDYAKKNPSEQDAIFEILSASSGRCGGVLEEFENLYFLRCKKQTKTDYQGTLKHLAWQWRQQATLAYLAKNHPDVHYAHAIRRRVAPKIGILPPQIHDRLEGRITDQMVDACEAAIKTAYPRQLVQMLFDHATTPLPKDGEFDLRLKIGEGAEAFQEPLINDLFDKGIENPKIRQEIEKAWKELKADPDSASEKLFYTFDADEIRAFDDDAFRGLLQGDAFASLPPDQIGGYKLLRRLVIHNAYRAFVKKEEIAQYLEHIEWMSQ
jgi:ankyrin repeat protein